MQTLLRTLQESDEAVRLAVAMWWGIPQQQAQPEQMATRMLDRALVARKWGELTDQERGILQTLLGSSGKMPYAMYQSMYGRVRRMGVGQVNREQPHVNAQSAAESLYYRGFVSQYTQITDNGATVFSFIPGDLAALLPASETSYNLQVSEDDLMRALSSLDVGNQRRKADTSIVDDMTTLCAFVRLHTPRVKGDTLAPESEEALGAYLLIDEPRRLAFMANIGISAGLLAARDGVLHVENEGLRSWLEASRAEQIFRLVSAWKRSTIYGELYYVSGLTVEELRDYDPTTARAALLQAMARVPASDWWNTDELIEDIKETNPHFQRRSGNYDNWYIRDAEGAYVRGFESWDTVEWPLLEYLIGGPMHWLGLVDVAPQAAKLNAYGRGVVGLADYPKPPDKPESVVFDEDTLHVSRRVSRFDRYQIARLSTWHPAPELASGDPYIYTVDAQSIQRASGQGISPTQIHTYLKRLAGESTSLPESTTVMLTNWQTGDTAQLTLESMLVLRTTSERTLDTILNAPSTRRFIRTRLGPTAAAVRDDQWEALQAALAELGMSLSSD